MRVARKLIVAALLAIIAVLAVHGYIRARNLAAVFDHEGRRDHLLLGRALALGMSRMWDHGGERAALALVDEMNASEPEIDIRFVWIGRPTADAAPVAPVEVLAPLARRREVTWIQHHVGAADMLFTYIPVYFAGVHVGAIELRESRAGDEAIVRQSIRSNAMATLLAAVAAGIAILIVTVSVVGSRVRLLVEQSKRIGAGQFTPQLPPMGNDEIGDLANAMNAMSAQLEDAKSAVQQQTAARLAAQSQLEHADRINTVGKLAAGIAHELGTPLNVVSQRAQMIAAGEVNGDAIVDSAEIIAEQGHRMAVIIRQLLDFARRREPHKERRDLSVVAKQSIALLRPLAEKQKVHFDLSVPSEPVNADVDAGQLQQAIANLLVNAIHAMPSGGTVDVAVSRGAAAPPPDIPPHPSWASICVRDRGVGVPPHVLNTIFDPFVTTKPAGEGTGLGLSVAYGLVREHGGWIAVESEPDRGAAFTIYLPLGEIE